MKIGRQIRQLSGKHRSYAIVLLGAFLTTPFGLNASELDEWLIISVSANPLTKPLTNALARAHIRPMSHTPGGFSATDDEMPLIAEVNNHTRGIQLDDTPTEESQKQGWLITPYAENDKYKSENDVIGLSFTHQW